MSHIELSGEYASEYDTIDSSSTIKQYDKSQVEKFVTR